MQNKKKNKKIQKSNIEKQYEKLFKLTNPYRNINRDTSQKIQLQTWVTYGAFEDPIF